MIECRAQGQSASSPSSDFLEAEGLRSQQTRLHSKEVTSMTPTNCKTPKTARVVCLVLASALFLTLLRSGLSQIPIPIGKGQQSNSNKSSASKDDDFGKVFK